MNRKQLRAVQGVLLGSGAPLGWLFIRFFQGFDPWDEITTFPLLYAYMLFGTAAVFGAFGYYVGLQESRSRERSRTDALTGLCNLRNFRTQLDIAIAQANRDKRPMSLIFFDLDHFKKVNDTYGHAAGDLVLIGVSARIKQILRKNETFARVGGEEFSIIVSDGGIDPVHRLAERIRSAVEELEVDIGTANPVQVTLSLGVTSYQQAEEAVSFVDRADQAMYRAKAEGRNRVVCLQPEG